MVIRWLCIAIQKAHSEVIWVSRLRLVVAGMEEVMEVALGVPLAAVVVVVILVLAVEGSDGYSRAKFLWFRQ